VYNTRWFVNNEEKGVCRLLPQDPYMLLSVVNMRLRDGECPCTLCDREDLPWEEIRRALAAIGYVYSPDACQFVRGTEKQ
jgi:hypothetical protein